MLKPIQVKVQKMVDGNGTETVEKNKTNGNDGEAGINKKFSDFVATENKEEAKKLAKEVAKELADEKISMSKSLGNFRWALGYIPSWISFSFMIFVFVVVFISSAAQGLNVTKPLSYVAILMSIFIICSALARLSLR